MNTKGTKFLAVLAVLAMAFAVFAVTTSAETDDAAEITTIPADSAALVTAVGTDSANVLVNKAGLSIDNNVTYGAGAKIYLAPGYTLTVKKAAETGQAAIQIIGMKNSTADTDNGVNVASITLATGTDFIASDLKVTAVVSGTTAYLVVETETYKASAFTTVGTQVASGGTIGANATKFFTLDSGLSSEYAVYSINQATNYAALIVKKTDYTVYPATKNVGVKFAGVFDTGASITNGILTSVNTTYQPWTYVKDDAQANYIFETGVKKLTMSADVTFGLNTFMEVVYSAPNATTYQSYIVTAAGLVDSVNVKKVTLTNGTAETATFDKDTGLLSVASASLSSTAANNVLSKAAIKTITVTPNVPSALLSTVYEFTATYTYDNGDVEAATGMTFDLVQQDGTTPFVDANITEGTTSVNPFTVTVGKGASNLTFYVTATPAANTALTTVTTTNAAVTVPTHTADEAKYFYIPGKSSTDDAYADTLAAAITAAKLATASGVIILQNSYTSGETGTLDLTGLTLDLKDKTLTLNAAVTLTSTIDDDHTAAVVKATGTANGLAHYPIVLSTAASTLSNLVLVSEVNVNAPTAMIQVTVTGCNLENLVFESKATTTYFGAIETGATVTLSMTDCTVNNGIVKLNSTAPHLNLYGSKKVNVNVTADLTIGKTADTNIVDLLKDEDEVTGSIGIVMFGNDSCNSVETTKAPLTATITAVAEATVGDIVLGSLVKTTVAPTLAVTATNNLTVGKVPNVVLTVTGGTGKKMVGSGSEGTFTITGTGAMDTLLLSSYNGPVAFNGVFTDIIVEGDNTVTTTLNTGSLAAINTTGVATVKAKSGDGSLTVNVAGKGATLSGLKVSGAGLTITGVKLDINMNTDKASTAINYSGAAAMNINVSEVTINMGSDLTLASEGIVSSNAAGTLNINSSVVTVVAGAEAIKVTAATEGISITSSDVTVSASIYGIDTTKLKVLSSSELTAKTTKTILEPTKVEYSVYANTIDVESLSVLTADSMKLVTGVSENLATVTVKGDFVIESAATLNNYGTLNNEGTMLIIGTFENGKYSAGVGNVNNTGYISTAAYKGATTELTLDLGFLTSTVQDLSQSYVKSFVVKSSEAKANGTYFVKAAVTIVSTNGPAASDSAYEVYGIATLDSDGLLDSFTATKYTTMTVGEVDTQLLATFAVTTKTITAPSVGVVGKYAYELVTGGSIVGNAASTSVVITNKITTDETTGATAEALKKDIKTASTPVMTISAGKVVNSGTVILNKDATLIKGGNFEGDIVANGALTLTKGKFNGNIESYGNVTIGSLATVTGDIAEKEAATITISGALKGDISTGKVITLDVYGSMDGELTYSATYRNTVTTASDTADNAEFTDVVALNVIGGKADRTSVTTVAPGAATQTVAGTPGYIILNSYGTPAEDEESSMILKQGTFSQAASAIVPVDFKLIVPKDVTLTIDGGTTVLTVKGVLMVEDGATVKVKDNDSFVFNFGTIVSEAKFVSAPYTYYCGFAFAIGNYTGTEPLELSSSDVSISKDVAIKDGVTVLIKAGKTLTLTDTAILSMGENAKIEFEKGAGITAAAGAQISGCFVYKTNDVDFDAVKALDTLTIKAADATSSTSIAVTASYKTGEIIAVADNMTGTIALSNNALETVGKLTVSEGANFEGSFTDVAPTYSGTTLSALGSITTIDGTMKITTQNINGTIAGDGKLIITKATTIGTKAIMDVKVTDGLTEESGLDFVEVAFDNNDDWTENVLILTPATSSTAFTVNADAAVVTKYIACTGDIYVVGNVKMNMLTIPTKVDVVVPSEAVLTIVGGTSATAPGVQANGLLEIQDGGILNRYITGDSTTSSYGYLGFDVTYTKGTSTIYTALQTAVTNATAGDSFTITESRTITEVMTVPAGVTVNVVGDNVYLTINNAEAAIVVGEPATSVGAESGKIVGKVVITKGAFVAFAGADLTETIISADTAGTEAVSSDFIIDQTLYATVYAHTATIPAGTLNANMGNIGYVDFYTNTALKTILKPALIGYSVSKWAVEEVTVFNTGDAPTPVTYTLALIGSGNFNAVSTPYKVTVSFVAVDGIDYYVNNVKVNNLDAPVAVSYGSVVTAQISDKTVYKGTPMVNGATYIEIDDSVEMIVGSGVEPIPEDEKASEWTITTILLLVLVVLIAIMAVIVALRLNRS